MVFIFYWCPCANSLQTCPRNRCKVLWLHHPACRISLLAFLSPLYSCRNSFLFLFGAFCICYLVHILPSSSNFFSLTVTNFWIFHSTETNLKIISRISRVLHRPCVYSIVTLLVASFCCCHCPNGNIWNIMWSLTSEKDETCQRYELRRSNVVKCPNVGFAWLRTD